MRKAAVMCNELVLCAALDTVKGASILPSSRHDLLKIDISWPSHTRIYSNI